MVALLRLGRRPWVEYAALVEERGSAIAVLQDELGGQTEPGGQTGFFATAAPMAEDLTTAARADLERWSAQGMELVTVLDPGYPDNLRAVHDRPPMIFIAGALTPTRRQSVAVVGARTPTATGLQAGRGDRPSPRRERLHGRVGLAAGIDTAAHTAALATRRPYRGGDRHRTARCYPPENRASSARSPRSARSSRSSGPTRRQAGGASRCATR